MTKSLFPNQPAKKPTLLGALARMGDGAGLHPAGGATMNLSTPIGASVQDGPRMTTTHFGGKKAAPFVKGGGRSKTHPNDAKGRKRAAAKALLKAKGADLSNIDLAMVAMKMAEKIGGGHDVSGEPRDQKGRWVKAAFKAKTKKELNDVARHSFEDYSIGKTSDQERAIVAGIVDRKLNALEETKRGTAKALIHRGLAKEPLHDKVAAHFGEKASAKDRAKFAGKNDGLGAQSTEESQYLEAKNKVAKARLSKNQDAVDQALRDLNNAAKAFQARHPSRAKRMKVKVAKPLPMSTDQYLIRHNREAQARADAIGRNLRP